MGIVSVVALCAAVDAVFCGAGSDCVVAAVGVFGATNFYTAAGIGNIFDSVGRGAGMAFEPINFANVGSDWHGGVCAVYCDRTIAASLLHTG